MALFFQVCKDNFNPRSREGSDDMSENGIVFYIAISIHAPAKGATRNEKSTLQIKMISIHAPAKGATAILYNKFHFLCIILYILSAIT